MTALPSLEFGFNTLYNYLKSEYATKPDGLFINYCETPKTTRIMDMSAAEEFMKRIFESWAVLAVFIGGGVLFTLFKQLGFDMFSLYLEDGSQPYLVIPYLISLFVCGVVGILTGYVFPGNEVEISYSFKNKRMPYPNFFFSFIVELGFISLVIYDGFVYGMVVGAFVVPVWFYYCRHSRRGNSELYDILYGPAIKRYSRSAIVKDAVKLALVGNCIGLGVDSSSIEVRYADQTTRKLNCRDYGLDNIKHIDEVSMCLSKMLRDKYRFSISDDYNTRISSTYSGRIDENGIVSMTNDISSTYVGNTLYIKAPEKKIKSL